MAETNPQASGSSSLRLFVAAALPEWLKDALQTGRPRFEHEAVRFVPRKNLHLTLHFIGSFPPTQLPALEDTLQQVAQRSAPFRLQLREVAPGPSLRNPRLVWARFAPSEAFGNLSSALTGAIGLPATSHQHPVPHVTLARLRKNYSKPLHLPVLQEWEVPPYDVTSFALWQSHLGQPHPQYIILREFPLGGGGPGKTEEISEGGR